jgi:Redoxin
MTTAQPTIWNDCEFPAWCCARRTATSACQSSPPSASSCTSILAEQIEFAERLEMPFPIISDPLFVLAATIGLPTFEFDVDRFYKRMALIAERGVIVKVFYPVFPPDQNAAVVLDWLHRNRVRTTETLHQKIGQRCCGHPRRWPRRRGRCTSAR